MEGFSLDNLQWYDFLRITTACLSMFAAYRLGKMVWNDHEGYSTRLKEWAWVIFAVLFTLFTGPLEAVGHDTGYRYGALLSLVIVLAVHRAIREAPGLLQVYKPERKPKR